MRSDLSHKGRGGTEHAARANSKFLNQTLVSSRLASLVAPIEPRARVLDLGLMIRGPFAQRFHRLPQPASEIGQFVVDPRRNGREYGAGDQTVALQSAQRQGQHPLRDAADHALDLVEAPRDTSEHHDDEHAPLVADPRQDRGDAAAVAVEVRLRRQDGHSDVLRFQNGALVSKMCLLAGFAGSHSYSLSYKHIPRMTIMKLLHIDSSV